MGHAASEVVASVDLGQPLRRLGCTDAVDLSAAAPAFHSPRTLTELTELLSWQAPSLYVAPISELSLECGIYICTYPRPREQLIKKLRSHPKCVSKWQGVVYCERIGEMDQMPFASMSFWKEELSTWGEYGMWIGPFLFFGDPALLQRIRALVAHCS
jgi:hypothetical protein